MFPHSICLLLLMLLATARSAPATLAGLPVAEFWKSSPEEVRHRLVEWLPGATASGISELAAVLPESNRGAWELLHLRWAEADAKGKAQRLNSGAIPRDSFARRALAAAAPDLLRLDIGDNDNLDALMAADIATALDRWEKSSRLLPLGVDKNHLRSQRRYEYFLNWAIGHASPSTPFDNYRKVHYCVQDWVKEDATTALEWTLRQKDWSRRPALAAALPGLAAKEPAKALALLDKLRDEIDQRVVVSTLQAAAAVDLKLAAAKIRVLEPSPSRQRAYAGYLFDELSSAENPLALQIPAELPIHLLDFTERSHNSGMLHLDKLLTKLAGKDLKAAIAAFEALPTPLRNLAKKPPPGPFIEREETAQSEEVRLTAGEACRQRTDALSAAPGTSAKFKRLAALRTCPAQDLPQQWQDAERLPALWILPVRRELLSRWLEVDAEAVCRKFVPPPANQEPGSETNRHLAPEIDTEQRWMARVTNELITSWRTAHPQRTRELAPVLWHYTDGLDEGWINFGAAGALAVLMPEELLASLKKHGVRDDAADKAISRIAERDPETALKLCGACRVSRVHAFTGWVRTDAPAALARLHESYSGENAAGPAAAVLASWLARDFTAAFNFAASQVKEDKLSTESLLTVAGAFVTRSPMEATQWLKQIPAGKGLAYESAAPVLATVARHDPSDALALLSKVTDIPSDYRSDNDRPGPFEYLVAARWDQADPAKTLAWCEAQGNLASPLKSAFGLIARERALPWCMSHRKTSEEMKANLDTLYQQDPLAAWSIERKSPEFPIVWNYEDVASRLARLGHVTEAREYIFRHLAHRKDHPWRGESVSSRFRVMTWFITGEELMKWAVEQCPPSPPRQVIHPANWGDFAGLWTKEDPDAALLWLEQNPLQHLHPWCQAAIASGLLDYAVPLYPDRSADWLKKAIPEPKERKRERLTERILPLLPDDSSRQNFLLRANIPPGEEGGRPK